MRSQKKFDGRLAKWALRVAAQLWPTHQEVEAIVVLVVSCSIAGKSFVRAVEIWNARREVVDVVGAPRVRFAGFAELVEAQDEAACDAASERGQKTGEGCAGIRGRSGGTPGAPVVALVVALLLAF